MLDARTTFLDAMRLTLVVAAREFTVRIRSRVFIITTVLAVLGIGGYILLQAYVFNKPAVLNVGFVGGAEQLAAPARADMASLGITVTTHKVSTVADGKGEVSSGTLDTLVSGSATAPVLTVQTSADGTLQTVLTDLAREEVLNGLLAQHGIPAADIDRALAATSVQVDTLTKPLSAASVQEIVIGVLVSGTLYISMLVYGQLVAAGVIEEKSNRIVEILLTTVRPWQLLLGKIAGIGLLALAQVAAVAVVGVVMAAATRVVTVPTVGVAVAVGGGVWLVLGYLMYAFAFAAAGSMVSRQEDVSSVSMPVILVLVAAWVITLSVVPYSPSSTATTVLSLIPLMSPLVMPVRIATGDISLWQAVVGVVLAIATIYVLAAVSGRIYRNSVLRMGGRVRLGQALGLRGSAMAGASGASDAPAARDHLM